MAVKIPQEYLTSDYDFGFSGVSEEEYKGEINTKANEAATDAEQRAIESTSEVYKRKLNDVERIMMPLLVNLLKTSDKEYIHWPNRSAQLEDKIEQLLAITRDE
jgi:hypothetical protein